MATNSNGNARKPTAVIAVSTRDNPKRLATAAEHAAAALQHSKLAGYHAGEAEKRARSEARKR